MEGPLIDEFIEEPLVVHKSKLEAFLAPLLGLRPASQVTIPAELPNGAEMGRRIDEEVKPYVAKLQTIQDMKTRAMAVQAMKKLLENQFEVIVEESDSYKAYYSWSDKLGLRSNQIKVRPTVHELYLFKDKSTGRVLRGLVKDRARIRRKVQRKPGPNVDSIRFAYPEEFHKKWLIRNGELLGYPDCCVRQYADDRVKGVNVESRASQQLLDALKEGEVDSHVYYTGFFFPCGPNCEKALANGNKWHESFKELDIRFSDLYENVLLMNAEMVLRQPELINKYLGQFKKRN
jgi:hypothetical protein